MWNNLLLRLAGVHNYCATCTYGMPPSKRVYIPDFPHPNDFPNAVQPFPSTDVNAIVSRMDAMSQTEREATLLLLQQRYGGVEVSGE